MTMEVLQRKSQIYAAAAELTKRGLSSPESRARQFLRQVGIKRGIKVGDRIKSWDVAKTIDFIEKSFTKDASVLDIGAFASEILPALHILGYTTLAGVDLDPNIKKMPFRDVIRYEISDFMETPFLTGSVDVITAISVIEHGFQSSRLLAEASRLLGKGGFFVASFDYWPEKIDTAGTTFFGMSWAIFSRQEIEAFVDEARGYGFSPAGTLEYSASEQPIKCGGRSYTFGWIVLKKTV